LSFLSSKITYKIELRLKYGCHGDILYQKTIVGLLLDGGENSFDMKKWLRVRPQRAWGREQRENFRRTTDEGGGREKPSEKVKR
jgi:hypothetical protein